MPYTPPTQQSPIASRPESPSISRSQSYIKFQANSSSGPALRPDLPRSAASTSYLHKHRRSPSVTKSTSFGPDPTPDGQLLAKNAELMNETEDRSKLAPNTSLRQSPPPVNDSLMPIGALMSPPDSSQNSSDDEQNSRRRRGRELENLAELQAAIRIIEQHRESSPNRTNEETRKARIALGLVVPSKESPKEDSRPITTSSRAPLSKEARKISHSRSSTECSALFDLSGVKSESPVRASDDSDPEEVEDDELRIKPPMVRKKSGELVRPALRPSFSRRRPSSMPGTPTYSKAVHFDSQLEHVRHFLQVDKPLAVSAGSSPVEAYEGEIEFPFGNDESFPPRSPPFEWEIRLPNFPRDTFERKSKPVRVEKAFLSTNKKNLVGAVAVANIAFHKRVVARFTLDYWKTTSEVVADFGNDVRRKQTNDGYDRFNFSIKLADQADLENKTMFFCVRYNVNGQEYWDNNDSINFQVDFTKKAKPQNGKQGMQGAGTRPLNALPRSRPSPPTSAARPLSMPTTFDDFAHGFDSKYDFGAFSQSPTKIIGESPIRFRNTKATNSIIPDAPTKRSNPATQAFGNRYDFGASLSAAIQAANTPLGDRSGLSADEDSKAPKRASIEPRDSSSKGVQESQRDGSVITAGQQNSSTSTKQPMVAPGTAKIESGKDSPQPAALTSHKPSLQSSSYHELLDKYCFFGSAKSSPPLTKAKPGQMDGGCDDTSVPEYSLEASKSLGSLSSSISARKPPIVEETRVSSRSDSPHLSRSSSPAVGSRTSSPVSFGYPYHQPMQNGFFPETQAPTAIRG
ncbi:MAG: hypothetical protein M1830_001512 [Pleopsidium flavum]|nr:MAG: hypothetical protein M1830_001512 [Pleopsidium flavum]